MTDSDVDVEDFMANLDMPESAFSPPLTQNSPANNISGVHKEETEVSIRILTSAEKRCAILILFVFFAQSSDDEYSLIQPSQQASPMSASQSSSADSYVESSQGSSNNIQNIFEFEATEENSDKSSSSISSSQTSKTSESLSDMNSSISDDSIEVQSNVVHKTFLEEV